ncbi:MAG: hypothetical protein NWF02_05300 [Candidatus Bathyarchaeota archaeon]|nr:hypothetical protein [Candidatus Bathyarchaeum sp.]
MNKKLFILFALAFVLVFVSFPQIQKVQSQTTIYIRFDGTVEGTDKIQKDGDLNRFVLLDNVVNQSIIIERTMRTFDGNGFSIQGYGNGTGISLNGRGTIKNLTVTGFQTGILVVGG